MIYIVEDDSSIRELEQYALQSNGYETTGCEDAASFWAALRSGRPELVILDVMLPDEDGYQILAKLRADPACAATPVIMVTAKTSEIDVVKGLDHGADDYLCKPFGIMEFISRVRAVLRRAAAAVPAPAASTLRFGDIVLDDVSRTVRVGGVPVELTFKEYALLHLFLEHPEEVLARERIMKDVWDTDDLLESRTIDMHVRTLRQKLGAAGEAIRTVRKVGYKLSTEGLILTGLLCALAVLTAATALFQRSYAERIDNYLMQICHGYAAAYEAQDTHSATTLLNLLPENLPLRITLIDTDGTVLYDTKRGSYIVDVNGDIYAAQTDLPNHADRPEFQQAMASGSACITRESETLQLETHYYAVRIDLPEGAQVLRVGEDVANIWGLSTDTLPLLCGAVVLILLAATLFSWWLTRRMVQPINHLAEHLDTIEADVPYEELIPLARTIQTDRKLREDNETMRREFTANVSHELKTPLTSISGYAELIETGMAKPADVPTFAARIHKEAQRMIALVSDILQLSELDSTQASHSREPVTEMAPVDLAALVKETAQNMTVNARRAYVTLQYDAKPATVRGSRDQLSELTQNLCDNAIRYNRPGGHVELRCGVGGDGCPYFEVEDNGIGIPQDSQTRVFERFYRVDKSRSKATGGTGLGLAIVKHIALLHDAKIDLQSQVGTGTTIRVTFPKG